MTEVFVDIDPVGNYIIKTEGRGVRRRYWESIWSPQGELLYFERGVKDGGDVIVRENSFTNPMRHVPSSHIRAIRRELGLTRTRRIKKKTTKKTTKKTRKSKKKTSAKKTKK